MRTLLAPAAFVFVAIAAAVPRGVAETPPAMTDGVRIEIVDPLASPQASSANRTGIGATNYLGQKLVTEISNALKQGSAEDAVALAHLKAVSAEGEAVPGMPKVKAFKLTSLRLLNSANAPDPAEQLVLDQVNRDIEQGKRPAELIVQSITSADGTQEWRAYRPLAVLPNCAACHGSTDGQSPQLKARLAERASPTPATGYKTGEWRGLLRITVTVPPTT